MSDVFEVSHPRINGSMLSQHIGKPVCIIGEVHQVDPNGRSFKLKASDNQVVNVQMLEPVQDLLEGVVEVLGVASINNTVQCQYYIAFPKENSANFDMALYNDAVQLMAQYPNHYITA